MPWCGTVPCCRAGGRGQEVPWAAARGECVHPGPRPRHHAHQPHILPGAGGAVPAGRVPRHRRPHTLPPRLSRHSVQGGAHPSDGLWNRTDADHDPLGGARAGGCAGGRA